MTSVSQKRIAAFLATAASLLACAGLARAQAGSTTTPAQPAQAAAPAPRPTPPTRDPTTPGYVTAKELPDGTLPPPDAEGNFIIGPTHNPAPEMSLPESGLRGTVYNLTMARKWGAR